MTGDKTAIEARLKAILDEAEAILAIFRRDSTVPPSLVGEAQTLFRNLKEHLKTEYKTSSKHSRKAQADDLVICFYHPAIQDAWANSGISSIRWDSWPNGDWCSALYDVQSYMRHWQNQINSKFNVRVTK